jgi:DNA-binding transcriptional LysR family regulator
MELRQLRYFDRIVMRGSFTRAAASLGLKEPTLSEQIKRLEAELGTELFDRSTKPIGLTPSGEVLRRSAHRIFLEMSELQAELAKLAGIEPGHVILGTLNSSAYFMAHTVALFVEAYPNINVSLREETKDRLPELVASGEIDAYLWPARVANDALPDGFNSARLFSFDFVFAVPRNHPLAGRKSVGLAELRSERLVMPTGASARLMLQALNDAGLASARVVTPNKVAMVPELVMQGAGIGFAPDFVIHESYPELSTFKADDLDLSYEYQLVWPADGKQKQSARCFVDFVRSRDWQLQAPVFD